jgi:hypothetical protein
MQMGGDQQTAFAKIEACLGPPSPSGLRRGSLRYDRGLPSRSWRSQRRLVGEEEVTFYSEYNDLPPSKGELVPLTAKGNFERRPHLPSVQSLHDTSFDLEAKRAPNVLGLDVTV